MNNYNQHNMFCGNNFVHPQVAIEFIYRLWYNARAILPAGDKWYAGAYAPTHQTFHLILVTSRQHRRCIIPQAVKQSLVLLEDGRNYRPKRVEPIVIINKIIIVASSWLFILLLN